MFANGADWSIGITAFSFPEKSFPILDKIIRNKVGFYFLLKFAHFSYGFGKFFVKIGIFLQDNLELVLEEKQPVTKNAG